MDTSDQHTTMVIADALRVIYKRKRTIFMFMAATVVTVLIAAFTIFDSVYKSTSQILIQRGREHIVDVTLPTTGAVGPVVSFNQEEQIALATEILRGRSLLEEVVKEVGHNNIYPQSNTDSSINALETPFERAVLELQNEIQVDRIFNAALLNVSFKHPDPQVAANVVKTLVQLYVDRHIEIQRNGQLKDFFAKQFEQVRQRYEFQEQEFAAFKEEHGITSDLTEKRGLLIAQKSALESQSEQSAIELAEAERSLREIRAQLAARDSGQVMSAKMYEELFSQRLEQEVQLRAIQGKREIQKNQAAAYDESLLAIDGLDAEFERLQEQSVVGHQRYRLYVAKFEESNISDAMDKARIASIKIVEPGYVPSRPEPNHLPLALGLAFVLGTAGGVLLAFLMEAIAGTVDSPRDVERVLRLPVLAAVPQTAKS